MKDTKKKTAEEKRLILVIESEAAFCEKLHSVLSEDYRVEIYRGAKDALAFLYEHSDRISLVMLDVQTVGPEGPELLKIIKNDEMLCTVPVIVLTRDRSNELEYLRLGASDFIQMPCDSPEVVLERVKRTIVVVDELTRSDDADELTGIPNQDAFFRLSEEYDRLYPDVDMDAVCVDISSFHIINDIYGREKGNEILIALATELNKIAEEEIGIAGRKGADVFLLYLPHPSTYKGILERLQAALSAHNSDNSIRLKMGIYPNVDRETDIRTRFDRAKLARDSIHYGFSQIIAYYDGDKYRKNLLFQQLMRELDTALKERQFKVYYQPKFNITGAKPELVSAEALIRWHHPSMDVLFPGNFISLFEENGLISKLDRYVWDEAASQIRRWRDKYGITFPVSVNVSRVDMLDPKLTEFLSGVIEKYDLEPKDMYIEITESAYTEKNEHLIEQIAKLRSAGFRIEMDDFGSGYSSLNMLTTLDIDALKLDINFIRNVFNSEKNMQMLHLMMQIKDTLNVPVVAEGVETEDQLLLLKALGCDIVQGYYFSKPVLPEEFEKFIKEKLRAHIDPA